MFIKLNINIVDMTYLNFDAILVGLALIVIYAIYVIVVHGIFGVDSLRNSEAVHRFLLVVGGIFIGLGVGSQVLVPENDDERNSWIAENFEPSPSAISQEFYFGILLVILGIITIGVATIYLRNTLWRPLEDISEYSAEFGKEFIGTRLPSAGGRELKAFSQRFNDNASELANRLSKFEIEMKFLEGSVDKTVSAGLSLSNETGALKEFADQYSNISLQQNDAIKNVEGLVFEFVSWYNETQIALNEQFVEIKSLAELGNLISVNAAIEASNLEVANPGFDTIAEKLHELAQSLEERQESLRTLIKEISEKYEIFSNEVLRNISTTVNLSETSGRVATQVEDLIFKLKQNESSLVNSSNQLREVMKNVNDNLPRSY